MNPTRNITPSNGVDPCVHGRRSMALSSSNDKSLNALSPSNRRFLLVQIVTMVYAAGLYLFADHHLMGSVHEYMAALLEYEARMHEAAYHQHQRLAIFHQTFDRYRRKNTTFAGKTAAKEDEQRNALVTFYQMYYPTAYCSHSRAIFFSLTGRECSQRHILWRLFV